ncbi:MAG: thermonuclease family protein [Thiovulaceae bacterium]|nr:thermonuclease family protein [Sulfurimonadaceae bacterium]
MNKILKHIIYLSFLFTLSLAKEPTLATLRSVNTNEFQRFSIGLYEFTCKPYGVITVDELYSIAEFDSSCKKSVQEFYIQNPMSKYFTQNLLKDRQLYHIEFKNKRCIIYAKGKMTMSELLVKNGLAVRSPIVESKEFEYSLTQAQIYAKENKVGLFKNDISNKCISELYKK